jgi:hypothetical protein
MRLLQLSLPREIAFMRSSRVRTALRIIFSRAAACASADVPELARMRLRRVWGLFEAAVPWLPIICCISLTIP